MFLVYGSEQELVVRGYINTSFQTDKDDCISQSGFMFWHFWLNGGAVSWKNARRLRGASHLPSWRT
jgi:hypothetical protein